MKAESKTEPSKEPFHMYLTKELEAELLNDVIAYGVNVPVPISYLGTLHQGYVFRYEQWFFVSIWKIRKNGSIDGTASLATQDEVWEWLKVHNREGFSHAC